MKIKLGIKSIFKYLYLITVLIGFFLVYHLYVFTKENVYYSINPGEDINLLQNSKLSEDLNIKKFNDIVEKIKQKSNNNVTSFEEIFLDNFASSSDDF